MIERLRALPRRLLHGGEAGAAGAAGGRSIASNALVQMSARLISMAISVLTVALAARTLEPEGFGLWTAVGAFVGLFTVLTDLGFTTVAMQRMAAEPERESEWLGALAGVRALLSLIALVLCAVAIPIFLDEGRDAAWILMLTILSGGPNALMAVFNSRLRSGLAQSFGVLQSVLWLGVCVAYYLVGATVVDFAIAYVAIIAIVSALQVRATRRYAHIAWRAGLALWRPLTRVAVPLGIASVLITVYWQIDSILLLQLADAEEAGIYGAGYRFLAPLLFIPGALMTSFFPVLSATHETDPARVRRLVQKAAELLAVVSLPILAGAIALSGPIVDLLYGDEFARTAEVLPVLMIAYVVICFGTLAGFLAPLLNLNWRLAAYSAVGAAANIGLNLVLIPRYGALGSAWATVATELVTMLLMLGTALVALRLPLAPWRLLGALAVAAAACGAMALAAPLGLVPAGLLGVMLYAAGVLGLRVISLDELRRLRHAG